MLTYIVRAFLYGVLSRYEVSAFSTTDAIERVVQQYGLSDAAVVVAFVAKREIA